MKQYKTYKDSGVNWIDCIPEHWKKTKFGYQVIIKRGSGYQHIEPTEDAEFEPVIRISDFTTFSPMKAVKRKELDANRVHTGDILIAGTGATAGISIKVNKEMNGMVHSYNALRLVSKGGNSDYFYYCLNSDLVEHQKDLSFTGSAQPFLDIRRISNLEFVLPPIKEQIQIVNYLNHKTAQLDTLITKKEQLINLLQEERTATINQAVTKGLDPNVPMKDSGIEWLGEIPENWELSKLKYLIKTTKGFAFKSEVFKDKGVPVVKASDIKNKSVRIKTTHYISENIYHQFESVKLAVDDILISTVGSSPDVINSAVGQIGKVPLKLDGAVLNQNTVRLGISDSNKLLNNFLFYLIQNDNYRSYLNLYAHGTANQASLKLVDILGFDIALPVLSEQIKIIEYIDLEQERINSIISKFQQEIELLKEYKTALISEVVTGKVDVREEEVN